MAYAGSVLCERLYAFPTFCVNPGLFVASLGQYDVSAWYWSQPRECVEASVSLTSTLSAAPGCTMKIIDKMQQHIDNGKTFFSFEFFPPRTDEVRIEAPECLPRVDVALHTVKLPLRQRVRRSHTPPRPATSSL